MDQKACPAISLNNKCFILIFLNKYIYFLHFGSFLVRTMGQKTTRIGVIIYIISCLVTEEYAVFAMKFRIALPIFLMRF